MGKINISVARIRDFVNYAIGSDMHAKRVLSLGNAVAGSLSTAALAIHTIGLGLSKIAGLQSKHAIKQVDRLISNEGINVWHLFGAWVPFVIGARKSIMVALDWTEFDADDQSTISLNMITSHGRATPLMWMTVKKSELKNKRNAHEDKLLGRLREILPEYLKVTILADRGFGDTKLYQELNELGFDYIIRFRENILLTNEKKESKLAREWVPSNGRAKKFINASVTGQNVTVPVVVVVKAAKMKESWCLACSDVAMGSQAIVKAYGRRFSIEENFRDVKDIRFGMGLSSTRISQSERRDRLLLVSALAVAFFTVLGAAGERIGLDAKFKANTVKKRTHSLYRQGCMYYECLPTMREGWARPLMQAFEEILLSLNVVQEMMGVI